MAAIRGNQLIRFIFFGNYFYGLCAVALAIEASLQQNYPINKALFYILVFSATVLYYSKAYMTTETSLDTTNERSAWYFRNRSTLWKSQALMVLIFFAGGIIFVLENRHKIADITLVESALILLFPLVAAFYYGVNHPRYRRYNLRDIGWLKPFIIGFIWAGMVTLYPVLYHTITKSIEFEFTLVGVFLFIKNFMYITLLCIMFDIKDYAMDYNQQLKTFVVKLGLRRTIFYVIIPLCVLGLSAFITYAIIHQFHPMRIIFNIIPFLLVISVAYGLHNRRPILYYLVIIDGLMLIKALCGIAGMVFFS